MSAATFRSAAARKDMHPLEVTRKAAADAVADYHKKRGRKIAEVKRQLPHDGYINDTFGPDKHDAYEFHPITSKDLITEADVNKAPTCGL